VLVAAVAAAVAGYNAVRQTAMWLAYCICGALQRRDWWWCLPWLLLLLPA
jgi:hypothetical protein